MKSRATLHGLLAGVLACALATEASAAALPGDLRTLGRDEEKLPGVPGEPGSGLPLDKQIRPTDNARLQAPLPRRAKDPSDEEALKTMEQLLARYKLGHEAASDTVAKLLLIDGAKGRRSLENHYDRQIRDHQAKARKMRAQAIRRYGDFLKVHPDDATWTPEIMYRLAELHFEASTERLARQEDAFAKEVEAYQVELEKNPDAEPPASPRADYVDSIALYRDIVGRFPRFHLGDGALYMMGTLLYEMEEPEQSRQSYLALACANKFEPPNADGSNLAKNRWPEGIYGDCSAWKTDSEFTSEAWLRIGEVHYDADQFGPALEAYSKAASSPEDDLYDEALIRVAWTLYLMRDFPAAAAKFDEFIRYADAQRDTGEISGALALRDDAVKYLAKAYIEDDWNGDGNPDRVRGYNRLDRDYRERGSERHVPEVYAALGDLLAFETDYTVAINIWQTTINRWPMAAAAPSIQDRILKAYEMLQDKPGATRARDALATNYLRGTKWFYANEDDPDTIEEALKLAEGALVATAVDHHVYAQELRAEGENDKAKAEYQIAARAYEAYLERFPDTESSYEYRYNFADALYYSGDYVKSAEQYSEVRDSNIDNRLQEDAAVGAVLAYESHVEDQITTGGFTRPDMPKDGMEGPFDEELEIPELMASMQEAYDRYVALRPDSDEAGTMSYQAAEISQRYLHFDEAQARFERVIDDYCSQNIAINAGQAILDARVVLEDLEGAQEWTVKLAEKGCGEGAEKEKFAGQLTALGNAVRFKEATILYDAGEFEAAADRYVALVDQAPADPNADRALNNAAVAYENIGRFSSASQTYKRIYSEYPDSEFADDALLRTGFNHSRFFEYEEAVGSYTILAEDERYQDSEFRDEGLKNAAEVLDALQEYERSAQMYERYAAQVDDPATSAEARFKAAQVQGKTDNHRKTIRAYQNFLDKHETEAGQDERVVEAQLRIGQAHAALGDRKKSLAYYRATVAAFESRGLKPATDAADYPSEAQFLLATTELEKVSASKIKSTKPRKLEAESKKLLESVVAASGEFDKVVDYKRVDWALGATFNKGRALEETATNIRDAPVPRQLKEYSEAWFAYKDIVGQAADRFEALALSEYEATLSLAKAYSVENEFTRAARERLNIYKPEEYPLLRQPALDLQVEDLR
ncbi:MAG: tetratricopeptide repeat protein [Myxococcota bacterium]